MHPIHLTFDDLQIVQDQQEVTNKIFQKFTTNLMSMNLDRMVFHHQNQE